MQWTVVQHKQYFIKLMQYHERAAYFTLALTTEPSVVPLLEFFFEFLNFRPFHF